MIITTLLYAGCIYEEHAHVHEADSGYDRSEEGLEEAAREVVLAFEPSTVTPGEEVIGYVTVAKGDLELAEVAGLTFYGDVELESWDARSREIVVSLSVYEDAAGEVDLVLETGDGATIWLEAAVAIDAAGSGSGGSGSGSGGSGGDTGCE